MIADDLVARLELKPARLGVSILDRTGNIGARIT
jgi:hypothetical protein